MPARLKGLILPAFLTCLALAVLVSLGNWQVQRLAWKEDLIARVEARPDMAPLTLGSQLPVPDGEGDAFLQANEYRPVRLTGAYRPDGEVRVFTSLERPRGTYGGPGHWVLTPFAVAPSGALLFINRGFVPDGRDHAAAPSGEQTIDGLVRAPEEGSAFTPDPKPQQRLFFTRDPRRIADAMGAGPAEGFFVDLSAAHTPISGLPQAGETRMSFANNHLQYVITWYGLAAALLAVFGVFAWRRLKEPQTQRLTAPKGQP